MGHDSDDTFARVQGILRIAHDLKEVTAVCNSSRQLPTRTSDSPVVIGSIDLPSPLPLLPSLLEAGISSEVASAASQIYQRRGEQFKQCVQASITEACRTAAELPAHTSALAPDLFVKRVTTIFMDVYFSRLREWEEEIIQRTKQASGTPTKAASRNSRSFNQEYVPLLEHFFKENAFPTHADKAFLAQKSNMQYKQIHVWFQNRRNRTKKEGGILRKKPIYECAMKPLEKIHERMKDYLVDSKCQTTKSSQPPGTTKKVVAQDRMSKDSFDAPSPLHAFPSSYPPTCSYDPFPCKSGPIHFSKPEWRRVPDGKSHLPHMTSIDGLIEKFSHLNVRDGTYSKGSPKLQSHAATVAITVIPSRAPHPSLVVRRYSQPTKLIQLRPSIRAPVFRSKAFQSPSPDSTLVTLVPLSTPINKSEPTRKRKIAPLPQRLPSRRQDTCRGTTPSESSLTSSSSPCLFSVDIESRSCSSSSISSLSTPSDAASVLELPHLSGSPCRSPLDSPTYLHSLEIQ